MISPALMGPQRSLWPPLPLDGAIHQLLPPQSCGLRGGFPFPGPKAPRGGFAQPRRTSSPGFPDPRALFVRAWLGVKSPRCPREALDMGGLPADPGGDISAVALSVFRCLQRQIFKERPMGCGFGTSLSHRRVCACPVEEVSITRHLWGKPSFPSGAAKLCSRGGRGMFCILPLLQSCTVR